MPGRSAVIEIAGFGSGRLAARLAEAEIDYPGGLEYQDFLFEAGSSLDTADLVRAYGKALSASLSAHAAIKSELVQLAGATAANLAFRIGAIDAEKFRWEAMFLDDQRQFICLAENIVTCRIAQTATAGVFGARAFDDRLTMAAFLSPAGLDIRPEYNALCDWVAAARSGQDGQAKLNISCTIYVGDRAILEAAAQARAAGRLDGVSVLPIPGSALEIGTLLQDQPVHLLHFFCHGLIEVGEQLLELATINDRDIGAPRGSIRLSVERLKQALLTGGVTWLTVLNCCSGAQAGAGGNGRPQLHSMALELAKRASPLAIGMAEPIDGADATLLATALYTAILKILLKTVALLVSGEAVQLDLMPAVRSARAAMHSRYEAEPPDAFRLWTLPVVYRWDAPLTILRIADDVKRRVEIVAHALAALPNNTPDDLRDKILASLDSPPAVPPALRPNRRGLFDQVN